MTYAIGVYSQAATTKMRWPVVSDAETLHSLLDCGDLTVYTGSIADLEELADDFDNSPEKGAHGQYNRAVAKGIREGIEYDDLLPYEFVEA
jgi:hypothetical protein|tara:strand:+ start:643 stop:915 length:273 start_codon:yes stop_codon:yes gene_type:complete